MASLNVKTDVQGPDSITINLVREDYLETSNTFRVFFEICLAITGAILGSIISSLNDQKTVTYINWFFLIIMIAGCISFLILSSKHYKKARCQTLTE